MNFTKYFFLPIFFICFSLDGQDTNFEYELIEDSFWDYASTMEDVNQKSTFENISLDLFQRAANQEINWVVWEHQCKNLYSLLNKPLISKFKKNEYVIFEIPDSLNNAIIECCKNSRKVWLTSENYASGYVSNPSGSVKKIFGKLPHLYTSEELIQTVNDCVDYFYDAIAAELGYHWKVINIRPTVIEQKSLLSDWSWHCDKFPIPVKKIMIYPLGMGEKYGGIKFRSNKNGSVILPFSEKGALLLFENTKLIHSAVPPQLDQNRTALELIIIPMPYPHSKTLISGLNGRHPQAPDFSLARKAWYEKDIVGINIGGGKTRTPKQWKNLDELTDFKLHSGVDFPFDSNTLNIAYSSHCFEHLCDATVFRVLEETKRCLIDGGDFVIKIPDFELVLDNIRGKNSIFFKKWNIDSFLKSWNRWGVQDSLEVRGAFIFCSIYSHNPFVKSRNWDNNTMYFGPAPLTQKKYRSILFESNSISEITHRFMLEVFSDPDISITNFAHQNAWSRSELAELLSSFDFEIVSFDRDKICSHFASIPEIRQMFDISLYCWARKRKIELPN